MSISLSSSLGGSPLSNDLLAFISTHILKKTAAPLTDVVDQTLAPDDYNRACKIIRNLKDVESLDKFLKENPDYNLNSVWNSAWTVLAIAIDRNSLPLVTAILDRDPTLIRKGCGRKDYISPYLCRAASVSKELVHSFLIKGANINIISKDMYTPLFESSIYKKLDITKYLLLRGAVIYQHPRLKILRDDNEPQEQKEKVVAQLTHIAQAILEIKVEYASLYQAFCRRLYSHKLIDGLVVQQSCFFSKLPKVIGLMMLEFIEPYFLWGKFISQLNQSSNKTRTIE